MKITDLKKNRQEKGLKQNELAKKAQVSIRALQNYERNERIPDVHTAQRIAKALNEKVEDLFPLPSEEISPSKKQIIEK